MSSPLARRGLFLLHRKKRLFFMLTLEEVFTYEMESLGYEFESALEVEK